MRPRSTLALVAVATLAYPAARAFSDESTDAPAPKATAARAPSQKIGSAGIRARGHVGTLAFTPDGKQVLLGVDSASDLLFFDVATGAPCAKLMGEPAWGNACLSRDGKLVAAAGRRIEVRDVASGKVLLSLPGNAIGHLPIAFSPDGKELFAGNAPGSLDAPDDTLSVSGRFVAYEIATGKARFTIAPTKKGDWKSLAVSPDGKLVALGEQTYGTEPRAVVLHDGATGAVVRRLEGPKGTVGAIAFSSDGAALAAVSEDGRIHVFEVATGANRFSLTAEGNNFLRAVAFSPDGKLVAAGGNARSVQVWDAKTGGPERRLETAWSFVGGLAFSPDGKLLAAASDDVQQATVELWEVATGKAVTTGVAHAGPIDGIAFANGGASLVTTCTSENALRTWTLASGAPGLAHRAQGRLVTASAGSILAVGDGGVVSLHDLAKGSETARVEVDRVLVSSLAVSPDGSVCVVAGSDSVVRALATADGKLLWKTALPETLGSGFVTSLAFDAEGTRIGFAAAHMSPSWKQSGTGSLGSLDAKTGKSLSLDKDLPVRLTRALFATDGKLVGLGQWLNAHHVFEGKTEVSRVPGDRFLFTSVALGPDGRTFALGSERGTLLRHRPGAKDDASAFVALAGKPTPGASRLLPVRPANPAEDRIYPAPEAPVTAVTFSPDGKRVAACFPDGLARVFDVEKPGSELVLGDAPARLTSVAFSPDGKRLAAGCADGTARVFPLGE